MRLLQLNIELLYSYIIDMLFVILLFWKTRPDKQPSVFRMITGGISVAVIFAIYITALIPGKSRVVLLLDTAVCEFIRGLLIAIYIWSFGKGNVKKSVYLGIYSLILYNSYTLITQLVSTYFIGERHTTSCILFRHICMILVFLSAHFLVDTNRIKNVGFTRISAISLNTFCLVYINGSMRFVSRVMLHSRILQYFLIMLIIFLLISVLMTERSFAVQEELESIKRQSIADSYMTKHYYELQKNNENVRTLAHDMKNHLIAIYKMSENGENEKINSYIDDMIEKFSLNSHKVQTGNKLIDCVISEKMRGSSELGIHYSVLLDARPLDYISDIDLCTFFGNALDNAIEACEKVNDKEKRFITIKSGTVANQTVIEVTNSCQGNLVFESGLPVTTKSDKENHGIGLKSIKKTAEKYGGIINVGVNDPDSYKLTLMLPQKK